MALRESAATCSARAMRPFGAYLVERGVALEPLLARAGLTLAQLADPDARLSHGATVTCVEASIEATGDPALGVHAAMRIRPGDLDVLEYAALSCDTAAAALHCAVRYFAVMHTAIELAIETTADHTIVSYRPREGIRYVPAQAEFTLGVLVTLGRRYWGDDANPARVAFAHRAPADQSSHRALFACPLRFDALESALSIPSSFLRRAMPEPDPALHAILERHVQQIVEQLPGQQTTRRRAVSVISAELATGNPGVAHVAARLGMSTRTLHRRLKDDNTSHRELLDEVRRGLSLRHLERGGIASDELAFLLGFSDGSALRKAFRRWHGCSISEYRRRRPPNT